MRKFACGGTRYILDMYNFLPILMCETYFRHLLFLTDSHVLLDLVDRDFLSGDR